MFLEVAHKLPLEPIFWVSASIIFYTYLGYPILLAMLVKIKTWVSPNIPHYHEVQDLPSTTLIVACYNEEDVLHQKIANTLQLQYPIDRLKVYFVTDGTTDSSMDILRGYPSIHHFHEVPRLGKSAAINRVMKAVDTPITVFSDANTFLNQDALLLLNRHFADAKVGAVAGEKRVAKTPGANTAVSGEGAYWKYESKLKAWDSRLHTVVGAAGELLSIRTQLYDEIPAGVLIEDFRLSMNIAKRGYRVVYEPSAYAIESGSDSIEEESKRKVRIAAGGLLEVWHFLGLLNIFKYGMLSFQFVSHRMLRWTLAPLCLIIVFVTNFILAISDHYLFQVFFAAQLFFYLVVLVGYLLRTRNFGLRLLIVPYYFWFMNYSVFKGFAKVLTGEYTPIWEKAKRAS